MPSGLTYLDSLKYIMPEVFLTFGICVVLLWEMFGGERRAKEIAVLTLGFLGVTAGLCLQRLGPSYPDATVFGMVKVDHFATLFKLFITTSVMFVVGYDLLDKKNEVYGRGETYFLLMTAALGSFFLVGTTNVILLYLGLETLGLSSYALAGMHKRDRAGAEASLKYVVYGSLASGILLYGASLLYGLSGSLDLRDMVVPITEAVADGRALQVALPLVLVLVGFGFKLGAFPFHWWAPDVYQGAPTPIATFLAVGSKGVAVAAFVRFLAVAFAGIIPRPDAVLTGEPGFEGQIGGVLALVSAATMIFGNLAAIRQNNLKRLLAYSSIAHAGYILMGIALMSHLGFEAAVLYTFIYYLMNLGAFGVVIYFANQTGSEDIEGLRGLGYKHPVAGAATVVFLAALTGLPPTAGFSGKWYLMAAAWDGGLGWLALLTGLMSAVSLFYYFRIAKALFLREPSEATPVRTPVLSCILVVLAIASLWFLDFESLQTLAQGAVEEALVHF